VVQEESEADFDDGSRYGVQTDPFLAMLTGFEGDKQKTRELLLVSLLSILPCKVMIDAETGAEG
jgi:hypothetical protein